MTIFSLIWQVATPVGPKAQVTPQQITDSFWNSAGGTALLLFIAVIGIGFILYFIAFYLRYFKREGKSVESVLFHVTMAKDNEVEISAAEQMFAGLHSLSLRGFSKLFSPTEVLSFEIVAKQGFLGFYVLVPKRFQTLVEKQIHGAYPQADVDIVPEYNIFTREGKVAFASLRLANREFFPIQNFEELKTDPLSIITSAMSKLLEGESAALQIIITPANNAWRSHGHGFLKKIKQEEAKQAENKSVRHLDPQIQEGVQKKISKSGFQSVIRAVAVSPNLQAAQLHLDNILSAFEQFTIPNQNRFVRAPHINKARFIKDFIYRLTPVLKPNDTVLTTTELATIFHFPNKDIITPHIQWIGAKKSETPSEVPQEGLYMGKGVFRGVETKVHILPKDRLRHLYIVGQTGTGKSEFLKFLAWQDIVEGRGVAFIDPHGDAVEDLLQKVPPERAEDVIYFNPADTDRPFGLNILEAETEEQKHMAINSFIGLLYKLYDPNHTGIIGPRLERAVRNVMLTAMEEKGNTLVEVLRLLTNPKFAKEKVALIKDPIVKSYWEDELAQTSEFHKSEVLGYFVSKFDRFVTDKLMRNIIGQGTSAFKFRQIMDEKKILLVNLAKGRIGEENSNFLGLLLVPRILIAAMSRVDIPEEERRDFYLYVDEFQNFSTPDFAQILSEARKYKLGLTVANQFIAQIDDNIRNAIFGNVGTMAAFRVGVDDADFLEGQFEPIFTKNDLLNNTIGNLYMRLLVNGKPTRPFSVRSDWDAISRIPVDARVGKMIEELSRLKYGRSKEEVEAEIRLRAGY